MALCEECNEEYRIIRTLRKLADGFGTIAQGIFIIGVTLFSIIGFFGTIIFLAETYGKDAENIIYALLLMWKVVGFAVLITLALCLLFWFLGWVAKRTLKANRKRRDEFFYNLKKMHKELKEENGGRKNTNRKASRRSR